MTKFQPQSTIDATTKILIAPVSKKQFGQTYNMKNHSAITAMYNHYLAIVKKIPGMKLTTLDLYKIDQIIIKWIAFLIIF